MGLVKVSKRLEKLPSVSDEVIVHMSAGGGVPSAFFRDFSLEMNIFLYDRASLPQVSLSAMLLGGDVNLSLTRLKHPGS